MYRAGHVGMALIFVLPVVILGYLISGLFFALLISIVALSGASLPDLDQRIPGISHRGFSHTIWIVAIGGIATGAGTYILWPQVAPVAFGQPMYPPIIRELASLQPAVAALSFGSAMTLSLLSHLVADALTVGSGAYGIQPLWPLSRDEFRFGFCKADSTLWNYGLFAIGGLAHTGLLIVLIGGL